MRNRPSQVSWCAFDSRYASVRLLRKKVRVKSIPSISPSQPFFNGPLPAGVQVGLDLAKPVEHLRIDAKHRAADAGLTEIILTRCVRLLWADTGLHATCPFTAGRGQQDRGVRDPERGQHGAWRHVARPATFALSRRSPNR
jgi:hypothetical protein